MVSQGIPQGWIQDYYKVAYPLLLGDLMFMELFNKFGGQMKIYIFYVYFLVYYDFYEVGIIPGRLRLHYFWAPLGPGWTPHSLGL